MHEVNAVAGGRSVRARMVLWLVASAVGAAVIAAPDVGPRVFSLSRTHGPSAVDLAGIVILLAAWAPVVTLIWSARDLLRGPLGRLSAALFGAGAVALVVTIGYDLGPSWVAAAALMLAGQLVPLRAISRAGRHPA